MGTDISEKHAASILRPVRFFLDETLQLGTMFVRLRIMSFSFLPTGGVTRLRMCVSSCSSAYGMPPSQLSVPNVCSRFGTGINARLAISSLVSIKL
jgi:hypothetical protein